MSKPPKIKPQQEVNAYLFYAQRLLHLLDLPPFSEVQADKMALTSAVCLSLKHAWAAWLKELSSYLGKEITELSLLNKPEMVNHLEVQLLNEIYRQPENWISSLLGFFEPRLNTPSEQAEAESHLEYNASMRIQAIQMDAPMLSEQEQLKVVLQSFKSYIHSVRGRQAEW